MTDHFVVYGDFNCPYSALAAVRVDRIVAAGNADVEWRAVEHDPTIPAGGRPVTGDVADADDRELAEVTGLASSEDRLEMRRPAIQPNTALAVAAFAAVGGADADALRRRLFHALWVDGRDLGDPDVLGRLGAVPGADGGRGAQWQAQWAAIDRRLVPLMILDGGRVSRGLGALSRLATIAAGD
ncbi:MAG: DsbA family oxidoreductase [Acidimicrobiales bacterium]